jgi:hypothetical protein
MKPVPREKIPWYPSIDEDKCDERPPGEGQEGEPGAFAASRRPRKSKFFPYPWNVKS